MKSTANLGPNVLSKAGHHWSISLARFILIAASLAGSATATGLRSKANLLVLPRFASLRASSANLRVGPGMGYQVEWVLMRPGMPLEIYQQYDNWRRVRDWDGTSGWIHESLLSGRRAAVVEPWAKGNVALRDKPSTGSSVVAWLQPGVRVELTRCDGQWCAVALGPKSGFIRQISMWGVYPGEVL
ncbi:MULTISPECIES: SH3 domain-containing protein [unclassified Mesorhizobium]|uniref:SH3 domain-containing protein n=1 Tax=unclassified Mesorhizobium TaxID=325217 RepID=UPI00112B17CC|nr:MULTISPECIES: SH3 domain-containing protein [unclassified Mesorhizobium]MBZ9974302.1 SH3 domain-containing protein [Mesorhizobium sp. BR-1-1-10]TPK10211.1 aspartyl-trna synthetase [Mesorhizobium sp. B2-5-7]